MLIANLLLLVCFVFYRVIVTELDTILIVHIFYVVHFANSFCSEFNFVKQKPLTLSSYAKCSALYEGTIIHSSAVLQSTANVLLIMPFLKSRFILLYIYQHSHSIMHPLPIVDHKENYLRAGDEREE